ncbi:MAG: outer membrane protein [Allorhizobium sp.]
MTDRIFGRIEYRYNDFGSGKLDFGAAAIDAELDQHSVKVGVGIKF